uniref:Uncharacterized protein n=1 Tax=Oryza punctata TaxID=4537 RepID=A0A0E0L4E6_ORYPU
MAAGTAVAIDKLSAPSGLDINPARFVSIDDVEPLKPDGEDAARIAMGADKAIALFGHRDDASMSVKSNDVKLAVHETQIARFPGFHGASGKPCDVPGDVTKSNQARFSYKYRHPMICLH